MLSREMNYDKIDTADGLIEQYIKLRDWLAQQNKAFMEYCAPFRTEMEEIEAKLMQKMDDLGGDGRQALKTEHGTAYRSVIVTPKIIDREKYLDVVLDHYDTWGAGMLQLREPKKEAVDNYMTENNGHLPPGVETSTYIKVNVRKT